MAHNSQLRLKERTPPRKQEKQSKEISDASNKLLMVGVSIINRVQEVI